ncbi:MAG: hypothetical protein KGH67_03740 [Candidatus Micrarchaeota archaeon]|nr:hypothetical protein [Candidatus Micrarchaeota archaeon]MDE1859614.1 hypothetical protein [Candidatus Micrarchaeota archaeon]
MASNDNKGIGRALLILGVIILLFTLYEAYSLYDQAVTGNLFANLIAQTPHPEPQINVSNLSSPKQIEASMLSAIASQMVSQIPIQQDFSFIIAILLLGLFASIGYKLASLGIAIIRKGKD